jgi:hypothetical protein
MTELLAPDSYAQFLADPKTDSDCAAPCIAGGQPGTGLLYWQIGRDILDRQKRESWGAKVIDRLAADPKRADSRPATRSTCGRSLRRGLTRHLCKRCLHESPGTITW